MVRAQLPAVHDDPLGVAFGVTARRRVSTDALPPSGPLVEAASPAARRVPLNPLGPGTYRVKWRVLSVDTHVTEGDFIFRVTDGP